jgi:Fe-S cluster assembly ATP-binding protein
MRNLQFEKNRLHLIIGPESSGKSSLAACIAGIPGIPGIPGVIQTQGKIELNGTDISNLDCAERAKMGIYVSWQNPPSIDGVTNQELYNLICNLHKPSKHTINSYKKIVKNLGLGMGHADRYFNNWGTTHSEKLKNELLMLNAMNSQVAVFDSIDQDMQQDELGILADNINNFVKQKSNCCIVLTNNKYFIDLLNVSHVSVLIDGRLRISGPGDILKGIINDDYPQLL